jgi:hypothetical protein
MCRGRRLPFLDGHEETATFPAGGGTCLPKRPDLFKRVDEIFAGFFDPVAEQPFDFVP